MSSPGGNRRRENSCYRRGVGNYLEGISGVGGIGGIGGLGIAELALIGRGFGGGGYYGGGYYGDGYYGGRGYGGSYYGGGGALALAVLAGNNSYGPFGDGSANVLLTGLAYGGFR